MMHFDIQEAIDLTRQLVAIKSYPGDEHAVQQAIVEWCQQSGLPVDVWPTSAAPNLVIRIANGPGPTLMLNGHSDTVLAAEGWDCDPWQGQVVGDRIYGLGACDMKSGLAANLLATRELAHHPELWSGTLICSIVTDEEAYSVGANALIEQGIQADYCIVSEAYHPHVGIGAAGKVLVKADVIGKAAHGFMPWQGINAASEGARFVVGVDALPLGAHARIPASQSILSFLSGSAQYVVTIPEHAEILVSRQIVPGESRESVQAQMQSLVDELQSPARIALSTPPPYYPAFEIVADHQLVQSMVAAYHSEYGQTPELRHSTGVSDANLFAELAGIPTLLYGPWGDNFHQCNEWVDAPSIVACCRVYAQVVCTLLPPK